MLLAAAASAATASAATRYAAPTSSVTSGTCPQDNACRLDYAVNSAAGGATIVLLPGDYDVAWTLAPNQVVDVQGQAGQPRPRLIGRASLITPTINLRKGGSLSHVFVESQSASTAVTAKQVTVGDVIGYSATGPAGEIKAGGGSVVRDSIFASSAASRPALGLKDNQVTGPLKIVNVTAVGSGSASTGIENGSGGPVTIANTIARGASSDIAVTAGVANAQVSYSNYRPAASTGVSAGPGNQSGDPLFVNAAGFNFHPALGSPTIDQGDPAANSIGTADPDGNSRTLGGAPDIGAYEYTSAPASSGGFAPASVAPVGTNPGGGSGTGTDAGTGTGTGSGAGTDAGSGGGTLPPEEPPVQGKSVGLGPVKGTVTVQLPGTSEAVKLEDGATVPVGTVIDVTHGTVSLTSVADGEGKTQTGQFWGGKFKVTQGRRAGAHTELTLVSKLSGCGARGRVTASARRWSRNRLWGRDRGGRFRTRGRNGSATVRGTEWLTEDRCDGTLFRVKSGAIVVRDDATGKNKLLKRGGKYIAHARAKRKR